MTDYYFNCMCNYLLFPNNISKDTIITFENFPLCTHPNILHGEKLVSRFPTKFVNRRTFCMTKLKEMCLHLAKGRYQRVSEENFEELLKTLNVNYILRKAAMASAPQMEVTEEKGVWTIKLSTILKTIELKFRVDEPFDEITPDGREVSSLASIHANKFIIFQNAKNFRQKSTRSIREFTADGCVHTIEVIGSGVTCIQNFKRL